MICYKGIVHNVLNDAPFIGALIIAPSCFRDCKGCHNQHLKESTSYYATAKEIIQTILDDPLNEGIILGGLEWGYSTKGLKELIKEAKKQGLKVMVYTSFPEDTIESLLGEDLKSTWVKYGEYKEELKCETNIQYGVKLATSNQYIKKY